MKSLHCEHESDVARAARTGFWPDALQQHAETCSSCAQTRTVAAALLEESASIRAINRPPDAAHTWIEARRRMRLHLRHRALFWFRALRARAVINVPALLLWSFAHRSAPGRGILHEALPETWRPSLHADFASLLTGPAEMFAVTGALLAALCITMGFWYLLREARTPLQHSPTR
jgi:hypothetical protein